MSGLPFVIAPRQHQSKRVGTLDSGILEIPILGGLTVAESATISELLATDTSTFVQGAQLSDAIAQAEGISQAEAFAIIEQVVVGASLEADAERIRLKYADRLNQLAKLYSSAGQRNIEASVTAVLRNRLNLPDWSVADTRKLPRVLLTDIWQLIQQEMTAENLPANRPTDDDLKKQPSANGNNRKRTGAPSSGDSVMPTQASSAEVVLAVS